MTSLQHLLERVKAAGEWREVPGWPYDASDTGVLRSRRTGKPIVPAISSGGYARCTFQVDKKRRDVRIHRAVAEAWFGSIKEGLEVNHIDGNKLNNAPSNLEIVTPEQNRLHAVLHGLTAKGERNGTHTQPHTVKRGESQHQAKLTEAAVIDIRARCAARQQSLSEIGQLYGVSKNLIWQIKERLIWTFL